MLRSHYICDSSFAHPHTYLRTHSHTRARTHSCTHGTHYAHSRREWVSIPCGVCSKGEHTCVMFAHTHPHTHAHTHTLMHTYTHIHSRTLVATPSGLVPTLTKIVVNEVSVPSCGELKVDHHANCVHLSNADRYTYTHTHVHTHACTHIHTCTLYHTYTYT